MSYQVTIQPSGHILKATAGQTVLDAVLDAGFSIPYGCRNGACGACKGKLLSGSVEHSDYQAATLTQAEIAAGLALFCCARPTADLVIECREISSANGIRPKIMPVRVQRMEKRAHDVMALYLKLPSNERMQFLAGQYVEFLLKDGQRRAFSLANAPHDDALLELHVRQVAGGQFTGYVFNQMQEKAILRLEGPFGSFYLREDSEKPIIFVAGGTGFAPIKGMIEHALHHHSNRDMVLYWGARSRHDLYGHELPQAWQAQYPNFRYVPVLSEALPADNWQGRSGLVHQAVLEDYDDLNAYQIYCCGAPQMVDAARQDFQQRGMPASEFFSDAFTFASPAT